MRPPILPVALILLSALPARAELRACTSSVQGVAVPLHYDPADPRIEENMTRRESWFGGWGDITCPGFVTLRYLTPDLTDDQRGPFCLKYDAGAKTYAGYTTGDRDAWVVCRKPSKSFCQRVSESKDAAIAITSFAAQVTGTGDMARLASDVSLLRSGDGAVTMQGTAGGVAGALTRIGSTALTVLAAPEIAGASAITVIAAGSVVYICGE